MRWRIAAIVVSVVIGGGEVCGQTPPPPGYSPYLNLARQGNPGVNYYGLVRPQVEFRNSVQQLQRTTTTLQAGVSQLSGGDLTTGHPASFGAGTALKKTSPPFELAEEPGSRSSP